MLSCVVFDWLNIIVDVWHRLSFCFVCVCMCVLSSLLFVALLVFFLVVWFRFIGVCCVYWGVLFVLFVALSVLFVLACLLCVFFVVWCV